MPRLTFFLAVIGAACIMFICVTWMAVVSDADQTALGRVCMEHGGDWVRNWGAYDCLHKK